MINILVELSVFGNVSSSQVIVAARSNNELDCAKLSAEFPEMLGIKESLIKYIFEPNKCARAPPRPRPSARARLVA